MIFVKRDTVTPPPSLTLPKGKGTKEKTKAAAFYAALAAQPVPAPVQAKKSGAKKLKEKTTYNFKAYQAPDVKEKLEKLFHKKCAYCESDYKAVMSAQVEHFRPKSRVAEEPTHTGYWWLASDWTNLLPSCIHCNGSQYHEVRMFDAEQPYTQKLKKSAYKLGKYDAFPIGGQRAMADGDDLEREDAYLIDPTRRHPDKHLQWIIEGSLSLIAPLKAGNSWDPYGLATYRVFGLNRANLVEARSELMLEIQNELQKAENALQLAASKPPGDFFNHLYETAKSIFDALEARAAPSKPYSAMVKSLIDDQRARIIAKFECALAQLQPAD